MGKPLMGRITFVKILIVLAFIFLIAFGLCGLTAVSVMKGTPTNSPVSKLLDNAVPYELFGMLLSGLGLVLTVIVWVVVAAFGLGREGSEPQTLVGKKDDEDEKNSN
jgi:ABC-type Fe3+ transport system permease subunit